MVDNTVSEHPARAGGASPAVCEGHEALQIVLHPNAQSARGARGMTESYESRGVRMSRPLWRGLPGEVCGARSAGNCALPWRGARGAKS
eukprot:4520659-Pyramimonas_sp.AAC.1